MNQGSEQFWIVSKDFDGVRLDYWIKKELKILSYPFICKIIRKGAIKVNNKRVSNTFSLALGDKIKLSKNIKIEKNNISINSYKKFEPLIKSWIIFKNKNLIVLNKPSGIAVQGGTKIKVNIDILLDYLMFETQEKPKLLHRLDKNTSGILLLARNLKYANFMGLKFKERKIEKKYITIVKGIPKIKKGKIEIPIKEKDRVHNAITLYKVLKSSKDESILMIKTITGRKHQIRKHLSQIGFTILGEKKIFFQNQDRNNNTNFFLHALQLSFEDFNRKLIQLNAPIPKYFAEKLKDMNFSIDDLSSYTDFTNHDDYKIINLANDSIQKR
ncbi:MAG: hypothetical protein CMP32_01445 [Rickettsiales bacterium]|nr:hypothetical protein [Rickettsiales bacterium]